jgi:hypothetical protein
MMIDALVVRRKVISGLIVGARHFARAPADGLQGGLQPALISSATAITRQVRADEFGMVPAACRKREVSPPWSADVWGSLASCSDAQ